MASAGQVTLVSRHSDEYARVEHALQVRTPTMQSRAVIHALHEQRRGAARTRPHLFDVTIPFVAQCSYQYAVRLSRM